MRSVRFTPSPATILRRDAGNFAIFANESHSEINSSARALSSNKRASNSASFNDSKPLIDNLLRISCMILNSYLLILSKRSSIRATSSSLGSCDTDCAARCSASFFEEPMP